MGKIMDGCGKSGDIGDVVVAGIDAMREVEKFGKRAEFQLIKRRPAELSEGDLCAAEDGSIVAREAIVGDIGGSGHAERPRAFDRARLSKNSVASRSPQVSIEPRYGALDAIALMRGLGKVVAFVLVNDELRFNAEGF
jgi:hypothetical protein